MIILLGTGGSLLIIAEARSIPFIKVLGVFMLSALLGFGVLVFIIAHLLREFFAQP